MPYVDTIFQKELMDILDDGWSDKDEVVRPKWEDGSPAHTIEKFGLCDIYDLRKEFPLMSLRPCNLKLAVDEILWIYQKKSNLVADLRSHIWDQWQDEEGTIGKAYGYQIGQLFQHHRWTNGNNLEKLEEMQKLYPSFQIDYVGDMVLLDQMDAVLWEIRNTPASRRILTNMYNHRDLMEMKLAPCCYSVTFRVQGDTLNMHMHQRSSDMVTAHGWNVAQYAALQVMVAKATGLTPGLFMHTVDSAHIYDRHIDMAKDLIQRDTQKISTPSVRFEPKTTNFYEFTPEDWVVKDYEPLKFDKKIPVAV